MKAQCKTNIFLGAIEFTNILRNLLERIGGIITQTILFFICFLYNTKIESNEVPREYEPLPAYQGSTSQPADDLPPQYSV